jgi:hypothetical protein
LKEQVEKLNAEELKEEADKQNGIAGEQEK